MNARIVPIIVDKFDPLGKKYKLAMADYSNDCCKGMTDEFPNMIFTFKLHNVDIKLVREELA